MNTIFQLFENWLDRTPQIKLFGWNMVLSGSAAISELLHLTVTYLPMLIGAILMAVASILKIMRDQKSWKNDERRKDERHDHDMHR